MFQWIEQALGHRPDRPGVKAYVDGPKEIVAFENLVNESDIAMIVSGVTDQLNVAKTVPADHKFFEPLHGVLFENFTCLLNAMPEDKFRTFEALADARYQAQRQERTRANIPLGANRNDFAWPSGGPIIMGSTRSIALDCQWYDGVIERLLPLIQQSLE